jgi:hypothetical protein
MVDEIDDDKLSYHFKKNKIDNVLISDLIPRIISESRYPVQKDLSIINNFKSGVSDKWNTDIFYLPEFAGFFYKLSNLALKYLRKENQFNVENILKYITPHETNSDLSKKFVSFWHLLNPNTNTPE